MAQQLLEALADTRTTVRLSLAGSLRRRLEIVDRIELLASPHDRQRFATELARLPLVEEVLQQAPTTVRLRLKTGIQADVHAVSDEEFPFALYHLTGSQAHETAMRQRAAGRGYMLQDHGLFRGDARLACGDEAELFEALGCRYIPPEIREGTGEIEAAEEGALPPLIDEPDIQGVFHVHSTWSDGVADIEEMARAAQRLGYQYLGLSDHSQTARYANGLDVARVRRQHEVIDRLNAATDSCTILKGSEVDILPDGSLDYPEDLLRQFDFVVASVHSRFSMPQAEMTARIVKAMHNPYVSMVGHLTGRLLLAREGYAVDIGTILDEAIRLGVVIELNANPHRLDPDWRHLRHTYGRGLMVSINPDAHSPAGLADVTYGVGVARKSWLTAEQILNSRGLADVQVWLQEQRRRRMAKGRV
jgi:DNA polymerase (family 10)